MNKLESGYISRLCFIFLMTISVISLRSQALPEEDIYLNWFDQQVGIENTALYEGIIYRGYYRTINDKIQFFRSGQWLKGSVVYSGQLFTGVQLIYDVFADHLIIKGLDRLGGGSLLLFKDKISSFTIDGTDFVNVQNVTSESGPSGFYELLWNNQQMRLLAKHQKKEFVRKDRSSTYHEFVDIKKLYLLETDGEYHQLKVKKDIIEVFPAMKKEIEDFYQNNSRLRSSNMDAFMISMINRLEDLLMRNSTTSQ